jgi:D-proline reductase (dithiol) PrdB
MDQPLNYLPRIREYYLALGYPTPYRWASFEDVPFTRLSKPLDEATISIITTAAPYQSDKGDQGPGAPYNAAAKFLKVYSRSTRTDPDLRISHVAIDRDHTSARDQGTYFPLNALKQLQSKGVIGKIGDRFHGLPTNRSHETTIKTDSREIVQRCLHDKTDAAILVPNCPVCHQSVAIAARELETAGVATVIIGCAKDIIEHVGVPRFLFNDFPLGNSAGIPGDTISQLEIAALAVNLLKSATKSRITRQSPFIWPGPADWKKDYSNASLLTKQQLIEKRKEFDAAKAQTSKVVQYPRITQAD